MAEITILNLFAGGFSAPSAISFASAFVLVSVGISIFSLTGYSYERLPPEEQEVLEVGEVLHTIVNCGLKERQRPQGNRLSSSDYQENPTEDSDSTFDKDRLAAQHSPLSDRRQQFATAEL